MGQQMKVWKILILIPYVLILVWLLLAYSITGEGLGGVIFGMIGLAFGFTAIMLYSIILGISLVIRWLVLRSRKRRH